ncbi:immunoglobulin kappa light chain-like [Clupea harengus]|uniref:immunoglobulin kappa light chain-like n=1 Tax=Clupea harengus TaxID=7950 RepID=UPI0012ABFB05|nr:immunoglobulin kappa light chain-like [Clupea harengus]
MKTHPSAMTFISMVIWTLVLFFQESRGQFTATQTPATSAVRPGESVTLNCKTSTGIGTRINGCYDCLSWYLQTPGEAPKPLVHSISTRHSGTPGRFSGGGSDYGSDFTLTISGVQTEDAGVYYCMGVTYSGGWVFTHSKQFASLWYTFGTGSKLDVGVPTPPVLTVLPPSREEVSAGRSATLVCVARGGYPSDWRLSWRLDGGVEGGGEASAGLLGEDGLYSWSSSLTLSASRWPQISSAHCEASHSSQRSVTRILSREQCSD